MRDKLQIDCEAFKRNGFVVVPEVLDSGGVLIARDLVDGLVRRHRAGEVLVVAASASVGASALKHPERNLGVNAAVMYSEPFIIGDLIGLEPRFARLIAMTSIWSVASQLLEEKLDRVVFHFSNITRKPALFGPALGWHRDADNLYFASSDRRTIRLLFPLQTMNAANGGTEIDAGSHMRNDVKRDLQCPNVLAGDCLALHSDVVHGGACNRSDAERDVIVMQFGVCDSILSHYGAETLSCSRQSAFVDFLDSSL